MFKQVTFNNITTVFTVSEDGRCIRSELPLRPAKETLDKGNRKKSEFNSWSDKNPQIIRYYFK